MSNINDIRGFIDFPAGLKLLAGIPIDARYVVDTFDSLDYLIEIGATYPGLRVFVKDENIFYTYKESGSGEYDFFEDDIVLSAEQLQVLSSGINSAKVEEIGKLSRDVLNLSKSVSPVASESNKLLSESEVKEIIAELSPDIPDRIVSQDELNSAITDIDSQLSVVAKSGKYSDLEGRPSKLSDFEKDISFASPEAVSNLSMAISEVATSLRAHTGNTSNPHQVTKKSLGLENVTNTSDVDKPVSTKQREAIQDVENLVVNKSNELLAKINTNKSSVESQLGSMRLNISNALSSSSNASYQAATVRSDYLKFKSETESSLMAIGKDKLSISTYDDHLKTYSEDKSILNNSINSKIDRITAQQMFDSLGEQLYQVRSKSDYSYNEVHFLRSDVDVDKNNISVLASALNEERSRSKSEDEALSKKIANEAYTRVVQFNILNNNVREEVSGLIDRVESVENTGKFIGAFENFESLPDKTPYSKDDGSKITISVNDFATAGYQETNESPLMPANWRVTSVDDEGNLSWSLAFVYSIDLSGKIDKVRNKEGYIPQFTSDGGIGPTDKTLEDITSDISEAKEVAEEAKEGVTTVTAEISSLGQELSGVKSDLGSKGSEISQLKNKVQTIEESVTGKFGSFSQIDVPQNPGSLRIDLNPDTKSNEVISTGVHYFYIGSTETNDGKIKNPAYTSVSKLTNNRLFTSSTTTGGKGPYLFIIEATGDNGYCKEANGYIGRRVYVDGDGEFLIYNPKLKLFRISVVESTTSLEEVSSEYRVNPFNGEINLHLNTIGSEYNSALGRWEGWDILGVIY